MRMRIPIYVLTVLVLLVACVLSCSKKGSDGDDVDDGDTPFVILDLSVAEVTASSVALEWTASGDDGDEGLAASYDMRYWRTWITLDNWDSAFQVTGEPFPQNPGTLEHMEIAGLDEDSTYYFSVKVCDEVGNCANPSNCVPATCFNDMPISFPDDSLEAAVRDMVHKPTGQLTRFDVAMLIFLDANGRGITSLEGIGQLWKLQVAFLSGNHISNLAPLTELPDLWAIQLNGNEITNISPIGEMDQLRILFLDVNALGDISPISQMGGLHVLSMRQCGLTDLGAIVDNPNIADADTVMVPENFLSETAVNVQIPALQARGVTVTW